MSGPGRTQRLETASGRPVADRVVVAASALSRARGLMLRSVLPEGEALLLRPCNSIHMFFMRFPLDVAFLDGDLRVLRLYRELRPWRMTRLVRHARAALELRAGALAEAGVRVGDQLRLVDGPPGSG